VTGGHHVGNCVASHWQQIQFAKTAYSSWAEPAATKEKLLGARNPHHNHQAGGHWGGAADTYH
jgi:hypothetical protein